MAQRLQGRKIAILVATGVEQVELQKPMEALKEAGATVQIVSPDSTVQGFHHDKPGDSFRCDVPLDQARAEDFQGLMIPGGLFNPDALRRNEKALDFARAFFKAGKPVAAICHGPQVLISAGVVKGRTMTGWEAIQIDLKNAGATVKNEPVVTDKGLVTSRKPDDIPAFNAKMIEEFAEGRHQGQAQAAA
jgi:protease I